MCRSLHYAFRIRRSSVPRVPVPRRERKITKRTQFSRLADRKRGSREAEAAPLVCRRQPGPPAGIGRRGWSFSLTSTWEKSYPGGHDFRDRLACATRFGAGWVVAPRDLAWEGQMRSPQHLRTAFGLTCAGARLVVFVPRATGDDPRRQRKARIKELAIRLGDAPTLDARVRVDLPVHRVRGVRRFVRLGGRIRDLRLVVPGRLGALLQPRQPESVERLGFRLRQLRGTAYRHGQSENRTTAPSASR